MEFNFNEPDSDSEHDSLQKLIDAIKKCGLNVCVTEDKSGYYHRTVDFDKSNDLQIVSGFTCAEIHILYHDNNGRQHIDVSSAFDKGSHIYGRVYPITSGS